MQTHIKAMTLRDGAEFERPGPPPGLQATASTTPASQFIAYFFITDHPLFFKPQVTCADYIRRERRQSRYAPSTGENAFRQPPDES